MSKVQYLLLLGLLLLLAAVAGCRSAHTTAAILYIDEQNYDKAVQVIHEGFQYVDNEPDAYYYLGEAYSHLAEEAIEGDDFVEAKKNYQLAYEAYQRVLEIDREKWEEEVQNSLYYNYSNRLMQAKRDLGRELLRAGRRTSAPGLRGLPRFSDTGQEYRPHEDEDGQRSWC